MLTSNIISFVFWHCIANVERGKMIFLIENIDCSQSALCPNFKVIKKKRFKLYYSVSSPCSVQHKHITCYGSIVLGVKLPGKTVLLDESQQRGTTPPDG